jgi:hypothetical protein
MLLHCGSQADPSEHAAARLDVPAVMVAPALHGRPASKQPRLDPSYPVLRWMPFVAPDADGQRTNSGCTGAAVAPPGGESAAEAPCEEGEGLRDVQSGGQRQQRERAPARTCCEAGAARSVDRLRNYERDCEHQEWHAQEERSPERPEGAE